VDEEILSAFKGYGLESTEAGISLKKSEFIACVLPVSSITQMTKHLSYVACIHFGIKPQNSDVENLIIHAKWQEYEVQTVGQVRFDTNYNIFVICLTFR